MLGDINQPILVNFSQRVKTNLSNYAALQDGKEVLVCGIRRGSMDDAIINMERDGGIEQAVPRIVYGILNNIGDEAIHSVFNELLSDKSINIVENHLKERAKKEKERSAGKMLRKKNDEIKENRLKSG